MRGSLTATPTLQSFDKKATENRKTESNKKYEPCSWTRRCSVVTRVGGERDGDASSFRVGWDVVVLSLVVLLPRQLAHHLQQGLVLLFELLVLVLNVVKVLQ